MISVCFEKVMTMSKRCTTELRALDVRQIQRAGLLTPGPSRRWSWARNGETVATVEMTVAKSQVATQVDSESVSLIYRRRDYNGEWHAMTFPVRLSWTSCNYGGRRAWWLCPVAGCGRRVAVLYGGAAVACRHCQNLTYKSQKETPGGRAYRQANKLRARLGWVPGVIHDPGGKPKGMHWRIFRRMQASHDAHVMLALGASSDVMDRMHSKLRRMSASL
jgi:hypothetical protein